MTGGEVGLVLSGLFLSRTVVSACRIRVFNVQASSCPARVSHLKSGPPDSAVNHPVQSSLLEYKSQCTGLSSLAFGPGVLYLCTYLGRKM